VPDGVERSERREQKRQKRWQVHGRSLEHVLNAIRRRAAEEDGRDPSDGRERQRKRRRAG
jgi:hypothetical protein